MGTIRALRREDLPEVCRLYESVVRSGGPTPPAGLVDYFARTLLDHPWYDEAVPSLVYQTPGGEIAGFLGSHVRRLRIDGRPVRLACSGQLVASPAHRGAGALLVRRYLRGPQEVSITDGATDYMRELWVGLGGVATAHAALSWFRVFRPFALARFVARRKKWFTVPGSGRAVVSGLDAVSRRALARRPGYLPSAPATTAEPMTPEDLVAQVEEASRYYRLHVAYDPAYARWLFDELARVPFRGVPVAHRVRDGRGRILGWYLYYLAEGSVAQVLQVAAPGGQVGPVLDQLFWHADTHGVAALRGRVEPAVIGELVTRRCLYAPTDWSLVHAHDPTVLALLGTPRALLTRLDGEWWMGHHALWRADRDPSPGAHPDPPPAGDTRPVNR